MDKKYFTSKKEIITVITLAIYTLIPSNTSFWESLDITTILLAILDYLPLLKNKLLSGLANLKPRNN